MVRPRDKLSRFGGRLKLASRKPGFVKEINELRDFIHDLRTMESQIISTLNQVKATTSTEDSNTRPSTCDPLSPTRTLNNINKAEIYRQVRQASAMLYKSLATTWSCAAHHHRTHAASVSCPTVMSEIESMKSIKLDLAVAACVVSSAATSSERNLSHLWLEVEYRGEGDSTNTVLFGSQESASATPLEELETLDVALTECARPSVATGSRVTRLGRAMKAVRFKFSDPSRSTGDGGSPALNKSLTGTQQTADLTAMHDICQYLHDKYRTCNPREFLGYIDSLQYLQRFYRQPSDRQAFTGRPMSLNTIITRMRKSSLPPSLPLRSLFHIAGSLVASVLQFQSTPWLQETWHSEDVIFFSANELSAEVELHLSSPYFEAELQGRPASGKGKCKATMMPEPDSPALASPNIRESTEEYRRQGLFCLGVILLEIAFCRLWEELRKLTCSELGITPSRQADIQVAKKLCAILRNKIGPKFPRIVESCIGLVRMGSQAGDEEIDMDFLVTAVIELQHMKDMLEKLNFDEYR